MMLVRRFDSVRLLGKFLVLMVIGGAFPATARAALTIAFEGRTVVIRGVTPRSMVANLGVSLEPLGYESRSVRREMLAADDDGDGVVRIDLEAAPTLRTIWAAVDMANGESVIGMPAGYSAEQIEFEKKGRFAGPPGQLKKLLADIPFLELLHVRPTVGAWGLSVGDGGESDADGQQNGTIDGSVEKLRPVGHGGPPPLHFLPGDVLILVDSHQMQFFATRVGGKAK